MAWYTINYACGHSERKQLYGKEADRQKTIQFLEQQECMDCKAEAAKENESHYVEKYGCKPLVGSPKQVAWAQEIRAKYFSRTEDERLKRARADFSDVMSVLKSAYKSIPENERPDFETTARLALDAMGLDKENPEAMAKTIDESILKVAREQDSARFWIDIREFPVGAIEEIWESELEEIAKKVFAENRRQ